MQISKKNLDKYKEIYLKEYWVEISDKESLNQWMALINLS